ncbi:hypothetical protein EV127DRAFT_497202 [Xylaria flabelliformis]|nr:hypothetical protein EV127DRAFT_497202 [Xylaria flabelliformis]
MASSGPGRRVVDVPTAEDVLAIIDAIDDYDKELDYDVEEWIEKADYIPKDIGYDWRPFCLALIENHQSAKNIFPNPPSPPTPPPPQSRRGRRDVIEGIQPPDGLGLAPKLGRDWTCVRYIPAWMDPEYTDDKFVTPAGRKTHNTIRDAVYNLRPALRLSDQIRRPTDYALRWGIAADRLDGRSRFSPTWSRTRNPLERDFAKQIEQLSKEDQQLALELSLKKWKEMGGTPTPGHEILPDILEQMLRERGLMSSLGLAADLEKDLSMGQSLDAMVDHIRTVKPDAFQAHQGFLEMLQDDQDYQRVLLLGLTTDELIQNNIHTMSNDVVMDLDNEIHPFFDRDRWDNGWWRGRDERSPRNAYNINGTREEYNIVTNDALWEALQPALRLVSIVLAKHHPHLEAIMNLNTRQPILPKEGEEDLTKFPPTDTRYVLEKDINMSKTYPAIRQLHEVHNYDWKANVLRVLDRALKLDIDSAYTLAKPHDMKEGIDVDAHSDFTYASTSTHRTWAAPNQEPSPYETIKIKLAADMLWPLLVPQYSKSEKMTISWVIASTLLHEYAHAVSQAQELLVVEHWQPPDQDPEIGRLLESLHGVVWDIEFGKHKEPTYSDDLQDELGFDFEHALWGRALNLAGDSDGIPRFQKSLMLAVVEETHPPADRAKDDGIEPMMRYMRPIPIDYMAKFFSKSFWSEEFEAYGFGALRMMPDSYLQKNLLYMPIMPDWETDEEMYGKNQAKFLRAVPEILTRSRHHVLGTYLNALRMEVANLIQFEQWWDEEASTWTEDLLHPLEGSIDLLNIELQKTQDLNATFLASQRDKMSQYRAYRSTKNPGDPTTMSYLEWQEDASRQWNEMLRYGGWLMQILLVVHNHMQNDIGNLQRMTFWHLAVKPRNVDLIFKNYDDDHTVAGVLNGRLEYFGSQARRIAGMLTFYTNLVQLRNIKDKWEQWVARFRSNAAQYDTLIQMLQDGGKHDSEPFDISWKVRFDRLPTGSWKLVSEIHKKMALREYNRADPAIRETIDEFLRYYMNMNVIDTSKASTTVKKIRRTLKSLKSIEKRTTTSGKASIFDFVPSPRPATEPPAPPTSQPPQPFQSQPSPATPTSFVFGVPGGVGAMPTTGGNTAPRRVTTGGVQKPKGNSPKSAAYRNYVTNLLTTPDPKLTSGTASDLFKSGLPQPVVNLLPSQNQALGTSQRTPIKPFSNPWASRGVMSSVDTTFQARKDLVGKTSQTVQKAGGRYVAASLWRENVAPESDSDAEMKDASEDESKDGSNDESQ